MKKSGIILLLFLFIYSGSSANPRSISTTPLKKSDMQQLRIPYNGVFIDGVRWKDTKGNHVVFYSATGLYDSRDPDPGDGINSEIFAYHYTYDDNPDYAKRVWMFEESVLNCPLATILEFLDQSLRITDLNNNGDAEIWFVYRGGCTGDITPFGMSIVMYERDKKYMVDGEVQVILSNKEKIGGEYNYDRNFSSLPDNFRKYADELWKHYQLYYEFNGSE